MSTERFEKAIERADRVMRQLDERDGAARESARRERQRLNAGLMKRVGRVGVAVGVISLLTIVVGLITPIGMFGFLAAVGLAISASNIPQANTYISIWTTAAAHGRPSAIVIVGADHHCSP